MHNAIKFNDKDVVKIFITVKNISEKNEISISDNGIGIPSEEYEKKIKSFYQVEKFFTGQLVWQ